MMRGFALKAVFLRGTSVFGKFTGNCIFDKKGIAIFNAFVYNVFIVVLTPQMTNGGERPSRKEINTYVHSQLYS